MLGSWVGVPLVGLCALVGCGAGGEGNTLPAAGAGGGGTGSPTGGPSGAGAGSSGSIGPSVGGFDPGTGGQGGSASSGTGGECNGVLPLVIRDFSKQHPDFEKYSGNQAYKGLVLDTLGADQKPVYAASGPTPQTSGPDAFKQWYNDVPGVNFNLPTTIQLGETAPGQFSYENGAFFPVDGQGFQNEGNPHNFHFTTEGHTLFTYKGGESFTFTGDDDLWLFINNKLAIDLGGLHPQLSETIDLDALAPALGIEKGKTYPMDIFHAERHTNESNFRIQTSIECIAPAPPPQ
jgi:fibro-slime domain-containing protein